MMEKMRAALARLSVMVKAYFPDDLRAVLLAYGEEIDRLRAEVDELRSQKET
ncbi:hypothetical protein IP92_02929 [Pseudoduganella flava]|uniref:Uncharacterized protein n=1 Tax=Pseudoduganella flava TaxID=871742 RepID=A0A562PQX7_9BURK|nr:hypothetical protein [Pseudoduganella flava]QGZ37761.1 hypothetical protein GO485_00945 [Pseudoduganella flava]TWI46570.1 hypothetical protein IP92_02929 [Pseudoduganella flava]